MRSPCYAKIERGERSPRFVELASLYRSLIRAGVEIRSEERVAYLALAQKMMENKKNYKEVVSTSAWKQLATELAAFDEDATPLPYLMPQGSERQQIVYRVRRELGRASRVAGELSRLTSKLATLLPQMTHASSDLGATLQSLVALGCSEEGGATW
jgi:hypothetical protein